MTHESLRLTAEFSPILPILSSLSQYQFNFYFLLILITLCFPLVLYYIFIVSKII